MAQTLNDDEDQPLDPTAERVQRKLRRLMMISGLTLGIGIFAVFLAIVYKLMTLGDKAPAAPVQAIEATVPAGARLVSTTSAGDRVVITYEHGKGTTVLFIDPRSSSILGKLDIKQQ